MINSISYNCYDKFSEARGNENSNIIKMVKVIIYILIFFYSKNLIVYHMISMFLL